LFYNYSEWRGLNEMRPLFYEKLLNNSTLTLIGDQLIREQELG
jgi:hypothetical protein